MGPENKATLYLIFKTVQFTHFILVNHLVINSHANNLEGIRLYLPEAVW